MSRLRAAAAGIELPCSGAVLGSDTRVSVSMTTGPAGVAMMFSWCRSVAPSIDRSAADRPKRRK
ncbi:hypothetical protein SBADM41S_00666 [Streptomyces badius]